MATGAVRIIGMGRAGTSFERALRAIGWTVSAVSGTVARANPDAITAAGVDVDLVLVCVPDDQIESVSTRIAPCDAVLAHVAGSRTLDVLAPHERRGSIHPLMSLPETSTGSERLLDNCSFAVAGDPLLAELAIALGGHPFVVADTDRTRYHATAAVAANHLVALCAQVERLAASIDAPVEGFWRLMQTTLDNVVASSPGEALTGPAARGDWGTIARHLAELDPEDAALYRPLADAAARLAGRTMPNSD